jgi:tetratricopeptide (TPR) repeat protein
VLTGSEDNTARLWEAETGHAVGQPLRHELPVTAVAFSPDGTRVLTGSWDNTARLWDVRDPAPATSEFQNWAELRTLRRVAADGSTEQIAHKQWLAGWEQLLKTDRAWVAQAHDRAKQQARTWHLVQADEAEENARWFTAAFHLGRLIQENPADADLLVRRANALAEQDAWPAAIADFSAADRLQEGGFVSELAMTQLAAKDRAGFNVSYRRLWDAFEKLNAQTSDDIGRLEWLAWLGVFAPDAVPDRARWLELAEQVSRSSARRQPGLLARLLGASDKFNPARHAQHLETHGAVLYRLGRPADAVAKLRESVETLKADRTARLTALEKESTDQGKDEDERAAAIGQLKALSAEIARDPEPGSIETHLFLAMAYHDLNQSAEAAQQLATAISQIDARLNPAPPPSDAITVQPARPTWSDRARWRMLRTEAEAKIKP